jgi:hypothetical protein
MAAVANNPKFAKKAGVPQSVGAEFMKADTGRKFREGGEMKESKAMVKKEIGFMKKAGAPRSMIKHEESEMKGMKKMATGGITKAKMGAVPTAAPSRDGLATKGKTKGTMVKMAASKPVGMKMGGKAGVKKMNYGGKAC